MVEGVRRLRDGESEMIIERRYLASLLSILSSLVHSYTKYRLRA